MHQKNYFEKLLNQLGFLNCGPNSLLSDANQLLNENNHPYKLESVKD